MEAMRDAGVKRVVFTSSGALYGEQPRQPVKESDSPHPQSPYAVSKLAAEHYVATIGALWGIETVALRIFNAYGPGQHLPASHAPAIPQFVHQARGGGSLVVFGDGNQTRDFVYIDDVVDALIAAATAEGVDRLVINIGSGQEVSINELAHKVAQVVGRPANVLHSSAESGGVSRLVADLSLAGAKLGFQPRVNLEQGLELLLRHGSRSGSR
jgi:UDP-glucose 4-epimerase